MRQGFEYTEKIIHADATATREMIHDVAQGDRK